MGNIRRIRNNLTPGVTLVKTGLVFGGSPVCLVTDNVDKANALGEDYMRKAYRSSLLNIRDMVKASLSLKDGLVSGEIWN